jgi:hypothetical protein
MHALNENFIVRNIQIIEAYAYVSFSRFIFIFLILLNSVFEEPVNCKLFPSRHCKELVRFHKGISEVPHRRLQSIILIVVANRYLIRYFVISYFDLACNFANIIE